MGSRHLGLQIKIGTCLYLFSNTVEQIPNLNKDINESKKGVISRSKRKKGARDLNKNGKI